MKRLIVLLFFFSFFSACLQYDSPKPRGYFRIALPEKGYQHLDSIFPYCFYYPVYGEVVPDTRQWAEAYWADLVFDKFRARIHLSYKAVEDTDNLYRYFEDAHTFVHKHIPKATAIYDEVFIIDENRAYGMLFRIKGREAASPLQFYATDSTDHFLRGALYFETTPNNDSLAPVIEFLEKDVRHMLSTLEWK